MSLRRSEPVSLADALTAVPVALLGVLTAFEWWTPTPEQLASLAGLYLAVLGVASAWKRARVTPMHLPVDPDFLDELALAAYENVEGVERVGPDIEDLHALGAPHGVNDPGEQGGGAVRC
jgi:Co/Zn/Cd efflux system component